MWLPTPHRNILPRIETTYRVVPDYTVLCNLDHNVFTTDILRCSFCYFYSIQFVNNCQFEMFMRHYKYIYIYIIKSFRSHYGPGVDSASNRNEYQEYFLGVKAARCVRLTTLPPSCAVVTKSGSLNFLEPSGPFQACNGTDLNLLYIYIYILFIYTCSWLCVFSYRFVQRMWIFPTGGRDIISREADTAALNIICWAECQTWPAVLCLVTRPLHY